MVKFLEPRGIETPNIAVNVMSKAIIRIIKNTGFLFFISIPAAYRRLACDSATLTERLNVAVLSLNNIFFQYFYLAYLQCMSASRIT